MLLACYDTMFSSKFCGSKAADFCGAVSDSVVVVLPANDLAEYLSGHDQALRRVLKIASDRQATDSRPASMLILVDTTSAPSDDDSTAKAINDIIATVNTLWSEVAETEVSYLIFDPAYFVVSCLSKQSQSYLQSQKHPTHPIKNQILSNFI